MKSIRPSRRSPQPKSSPNHSLTGRFFHSYRDTEIIWQGEILADMGRGFHLIRLFGWWDGEETERRVVPLETLASMRFYASVEEMRNAFEVHRRRSMRSDKSTGEKSDEVLETIQ